MPLGQLGLAPLGSFGRARQQGLFDDELAPDDEQGIMRQAMDVGLSGLAKVGNVLDLPGSSVRDILSGENPFDQWLPWNWTSHQNRTSPEDMLQKFGVLSPQFRSQHPVWSFLGGTAAAIATDPLTYVGLPGVSRLKPAGEALKKAGLLWKLDNVLPQGVGRAEGMLNTKLGAIVPEMGDIAAKRAEARAAEASGRAAGGSADDLFKATMLRDEAKSMYRDYRAAKQAAKSMGTSLDALRTETLGYRNLLPESLQKPFAQTLDKTSDWISHTVPARAIGAMFDAAKGGQFGYYGQKVATMASRLRPEATMEANARTAKFADEMREVVQGFKKTFGEGTPYEMHDAEVFDLVQDLTRFSHEAGGRGFNMANPSPQYQQGLDIVKDAALRRINAGREAGAQISGIGALPTGPEWQKLESLATKIRDTNKAIQQRTRMMGGDIGEIDIHSARYVGAKTAQSEKFDALRGGRVLGVKGPSQAGRSEEIARIYTPVVNEMLVDDAVRIGADGKTAATAEEAAQAIFKKYGVFLDDTYKAADDLKKIADDTTMTPAAKQAAEDARKIKATLDHANDLGKWVVKHKQRPMFDNPNLIDEMHYLSHQLKVNKSIEAIHEAFRRTAVVMDPDDPSIIKPALSFARGRWSRGTPDVEQLAAKTGDRATEFKWTKLETAFQDAGFRDARTEKALEYFAEKAGITIDEAKQMYVPAQLANEASGFLEAVTNTRFQSLMGDAIDAMNRVFKIGVTAHPANWVRNRYSGVVVNLTASGEVRGAGDIARYAHWDRFAKEHRNDPHLIRDVLIHNAVDPEFGSESVEFGVRRGSRMDVFSGLPPVGAPKTAGDFPIGSVVYSKDRSNYGRVIDTNADSVLAKWTNPETQATETKWLPKENFVPAAQAEKWWNVKQSFREAQAAEKGTVSGAFEVLTGQPPGYAAKTLRGVDAMDDVAKRIQTLWQTGVNTSAKANAAVEWQNRVAMYLYLINEKGYSKASAAEKVRRLQLDYRAGLSGFEKTVMRRAIPFYAFSRLMAGNIADTLLQRPGGVMAQMIKASSRVGERDAMTPDYVSEGLSFKYGETPEGDRRYFSATGMPYEDLFSFFGGAKPSRSLLLEAGSRMTPYLKAPVEWAMGRSMFQQGPSGGRNIEDLDPVIGRTARNAQQYLRYLAGDKQALKERPAPVRVGPLTEHILSNSPFSRYMTSTRTLLDPRKTAIEKAVNLLTGARATTISPAASDTILRERTELLGKELGARSFTRPYFSDKTLATLSPDELEKAEKLQAIWKAINKRAKERAKAESMTPRTF